MKSFITALVLAAVLAAASIFHIMRLESISAALLEMNSQITASLEAEDYESACRIIDDMTRKLEGFEPFFAAMGNHEEIDNIEMTLAELRSYAEGGFKYDAEAKSYTLDFLFEHLPKNSRLRFENIW